MSKNACRAPSVGPGGRAPRRGSPSAPRTAAPRRSSPRARARRRGRGNRAATARRAKCPPSAHAVKVLAPWPGCAGSFPRGVLGIRSTSFGLCAAASLLRRRERARAVAVGRRRALRRPDPVRVRAPERSAPGTEYPDPDADPLCVEFDKTNQNVTDFGIVDFTAQEPARVAAAGDKCFYFQRDHWTGSVAAGPGARGLALGRRLLVRPRPRRRRGQRPQLPDRRPAAERDAVRPRGLPALLRRERRRRGRGADRDAARTRAAPPRSTRPRSATRSTATAPRSIACIDPGGGIRGKRVGRARLGGERERAAGQARPADVRAQASRLAGAWSARASCGSPTRPTAARRRS